jgi:dUTPase
VDEEDPGGLIGNMISQQQSPQAYAGNVNEDNKVIIVENCEDGEVIINDNDQIIQTNTQSFSQEANNQVDEEDPGGLIGNMISQQQSPQAYAGNVNEDNKVIIVENCEDGEVIINDNDQIIQTNTQSFSQEANNQVDEEGEEEEEGDG